MRLDLLLPSLSVIKEQAAEWPYYLEHWWYTLRLSLAACGLALLLAVACVGLCFSYRYAKWAMSPIAVISQSFPLQAIAPLLVIFFGAGMPAQMATATIICFFPIFGIMTGAVDNLPRGVTYLLITAGGSRFTRFFRVIIRTRSALT